MAHPLDSLLAALSAGGARPCLFEHGRWHGAAEVAAAVQRWRGLIAARLPHPGAVLGLQAGFGLDALACLLAAWQLRAIVALLPPGMPREEAASLARCDVVLCLDGGGGAGWSVHPQQRHSPLLDSLRASGEPGVIIFTSGSTGRPRAAVHALSRLLGKFAAGGRALRTLAVMQFDHLAGLDALLYTLCAGGGFVIARNRTPEAVCAAVAAARVEVLSTSPSFLRLLCLSGAAREADLSSLTTITYGSEPMDPATLARVNAQFPGARVLQKYGTTELGAPRTLSQGNDSLWIRLGGEGVEIEVREGVLWVRSAGQFLGYLDGPSPFDADGWYCTGDHVEVRDGWMHILGRQSELISVGGEKVAPSQVEAVILEVHGVLATAVHGEANALLGQIVVARVEMELGFPQEQAERIIRQHCRNRLPAYQVPVRVEVTRDLVGERHKLLRRAPEAPQPGRHAADRQNW